MRISKSYLVYLLAYLIAGSLSCRAQEQTQKSNSKHAWIPDVGDSEYRNPIIFADYSDPDVCRKGNVSYSYDGKSFSSVADDFEARPGRWIGAKLGIFCTSKVKADDSGYADFDWFRVR